MKGCVVAVILGLGFGLLSGEEAADYFGPAAGLRGEALELVLREIIDGHNVISYGGLWTALPDLYEDPEDSGRLILFYSEASWDVEDRDRGFGYEEYWNREHLWPRSYGIGDSGADYSDLFQVVPANKAVNGDRSNKHFGEVEAGDRSLEVPAHPLAPESRESFYEWEPGDAQKGWAARAMLYMPTRYDYLELVDIPEDTELSTSGNAMAQKTVLLDWNRRFPPTAQEREFNEAVYADWQFNRNPYISFPEFADALYVDGPSWGDWRLEFFSLAELLDEEISGDGADPDGDGLSNLMERARYSDPRDGSDGPALEGRIGGGQIELRWIRCVDGESLMARMELVRTEDLHGGTWEVVETDAAEVVALSGEQEEVVLTVPLPEESAGVLYRLRVERD